MVDWCSGKPVKRRMVSGARGGVGTARQAVVEANFPITLRHMRRFSILPALSAVGLIDGDAESADEAPAELADLARRINLTEQQIRELLENRTTLLAGISHDLRTPIARLQLELELLPTDLEPQLVAGMRQDLEEMDNLIGRTLELARGLDRHDPPDTLPEDLLQQLSTDYSRGGNQLLLEGLSGCAVRVAGKPLRRVLANLLDNALRYGGDSPVTLRLQCGKERAAIAVIDHGPGIPETEREAVLRPFYRLEGSRAKDTGGSGLGLAIAKQLCEAYGWRLTLANTPGGGLTVLVEVSGAPA